MENTTFEELYSDFLDKIQDYKQRNLFVTNEKIATNQCLSYLKQAIAKFGSCKKDIFNPNFNLGEFNCTLSIKESDIITNLMVEAWMRRVCLDIRQMNLTLDDNSFEHFSEEKNLKEKSEVYDKLREINSQDMWNYEIENVPWQNWAAGDYGI